MTYIETIEAALPLFDLFAFVFGACVGSFLNVVIWRLPRRESLISPPSHCPQCDRRLRPWENIPILAWLWLRARCAGCGNRISVRYPLVEAFAAAVFLLLWRRIWNHDLPLTALAPAFFLAATVIAAGVIDAEHRIIPDRLTGTALLAALAFAGLWPESRLGGAEAVFNLFAQNLLGWIPSLPATPWPAFNQRIEVWLETLFAVVGVALPLLALRQIGRLLWGRVGYAPAAGKNLLQVTPEAILLNGQPIADGEGTTARTTGSRTFQVRHLELATAPGTDAPEPPAAKPETQAQRLKISGQAIRIDNHRMSRHQLKRLVAEVVEWTAPREVLGLGDIKLLAVIGGFVGLAAALDIVFLSSLLGVTVGGILLAMQKSHRNWTLPYAPYIAFATLVWLLSGTGPLALWQVFR